MPRQVTVLEDDENWIQFLGEVFENTSSCLQVARSAGEAVGPIQKGRPDLVFVNPALLTRPLVAALELHRTTNAGFRTFRLGAKAGATSPLPFDGVFDQLPSISEFLRAFVQRLPVPEKIRLLVVDDQPEIRDMFTDYFNGRTQPVFTVETARNGIEGEERIKLSPPDVLVLDLKMPEQDGRELYRRLKNNGSLVPTIIFFDAASADEVLEIRRWGRPTFVEKGSRSSAMPEMSNLIKKLVYFSPPGGAN